MRPFYALFALSLSWASANMAAACEPDPVLEALAAELISQPQPPTGEYLLREARARGSELPVIYALRSSDTSLARRGRFLRMLSQRRPGPWVCASAEANGRVLRLAAPAAGRLHYDEGLIVIRLDSSLASARLHVLDAQGRAYQRAVVDGERLRLPSQLVEPLRLQVVADTEQGPLVIAERGESETDAQTSIELPSVRESFAELRRRVGRSRLRDNALLARIARAHAQYICRAHRVGHLEPSGNPTQRMRRAGLVARHSGEVVAQAADSAAAWRLLEHSPSHRAAMLDSRFTDAGVGEAEDTEGHRCVVIAMAAWPRMVGGAAPR